MNNVLSLRAVCARTRFILLSLLAGPWMIASLPAAAEKPEFAAGRILVQPAAGLGHQSFSQLLHKNNSLSIRRIGNKRTHVVSVPRGREEAIAQALARNPHIKFAEPDYFLNAAMTPNDPKYPNAWHLQAMQVDQAWATNMGNGVVVAILDTGVDAVHLDLAGKLVPGRNVVSGNNVTSDVNGHGTSVAGVVAAATNNALGVASIAPDAFIMPVRITNNTDSTAYASDIANGLYWAADNGAHVANISYIVTNSHAVQTAAQYFRDKGGVVVTAAGNQGTDLGHSANPYLVTVAATASNDVRTSWSNYGSYVDLAAPGVGLWSTARGGGYVAGSGTSVSSPAVAAIVALIKSTNPGLSPTEIESVLLTTADDLGESGFDAFYGYGRANARAAVELAAAADPSDTTPPSVALVSPATDSEVSGLIAVEVSASDSFGVSRADLLVNGLVTASDTTAPYLFSWDSARVLDGPATLQARAYDEAGNLAYSTKVSVTVNNGSAADGNAPTVEITSPTDGASVSGSVTIVARANDTDGISMLTIKVNNKTRCSGDLNQLSCGWNTRKASAGQHTLTAVATDRSGQSSEMSITVNVAGSGGGKTGGGTGKGKGGGKGKNKG